MTSNDRLVSAQGAVREGAQAIDNLLHLLGSRRVGPKAIGRALRDVRDGCAALTAALGELTGALTDVLMADEDARVSARSLLVSATRTVDGLAVELAAVKRADVDARDRLAVEAVVRRTSAQLEGILFEVDLLACAAVPRNTQLDVRDVLYGQAITPTRSAGPTMQATADIEERLAFTGDARLIGGVLLLAIAMVAQGSGQRPHIRARALSEDQIEVRVSAGPQPDVEGASQAPRHVLDLPIFDVAPEGPAAAYAVAKLAGITLLIDASSKDIRLILGRVSGAGERDATQGSRL